MITKKFALFLFVLAIVGILMLSDFGRFLTIDELRRRNGQLLALYDLHPAGVIAAFMAIQICALALSLPGAVFTLALAGGAIFGSSVGTVVVLMALTIGDSLGFLLARYLLKDLVEAKFKRQAVVVQRGVARDGAFYLLALRMTAVMPYFVVNWLMGLTPLPLRIFAPVSFIGLLPATALYVQAGTSIARVRVLSDVMSMQLLLLLASLGILPIAARAAIRRYRKI